MQVPSAAWSLSGVPLHAKEWRTNQSWADQLYWSSARTIRRQANIFYILPPTWGGFNFLKEGGVIW